MISTLTRLRAPSQSQNLNVHAPPVESADYNLDLAALAARILFKSPLPSEADLPVYILDSAALPDAKDVQFDTLLPYVLARLPSEEELAGGQGYEIVFFAGGAGAPDGEPRDRKKKQKKRNKKDAPSDGGEDEEVNAPKKKSRPGWAWFLQAYSRLNRMMRKRLMHLYVVHEKGWVRVVMEMFTTIVSPKVRKKVVHGRSLPDCHNGQLTDEMIVNSLTGLALHIPIENLLIPPSAYLYDRRKSPDIFAPYASGKRAFGVKDPFPVSTTGNPRLPRVLRETTSFLLSDSLIEVEGIFRVSAKAQNVEILKEAYNRGQKFIVWKDHGSALTFPQYKPGTGTVTVEELDEIEGYGVHVASALIKLWYHELREPIFPSSSYQALEKYHGEPKATSPDQLQQMLSPASFYSPLSETAGRILTDHLLPLLSRIAKHSEENRMTPQNLAVVFAPNMVCGPDPLEDMKIVAIAQRLLVDMITNWTELASRLGRTDEMFEASLRLPQAVADREDPLEEVRQGHVSRPSVNGVEQMTGIALVDNEDDDSSSDDEEECVDSLPNEGNRPSLPPRRSETQNSGLVEDSSTTSPVRRKPAPGAQADQPPLNTAMSTISLASSESPAEGVRRKPAPAVAALPRYSTIVTNRPAVLAALERYNSMSSQSGRNRSTSQSQLLEDLPSYEQSTPVHESLQPLMPGSNARSVEQETPVAPEKVHRKPIGDGEGKDG